MLTLALAGALGLPTALRAQNIVINGGFETGNFSGWAQGGNTGFTGVGTSPVNSGTYSAFFGPVGSTGTITQLLPTSAGSNYTLKFFLDAANSSNFFAVSFNGSTLTSGSIPTQGFTLYTFTGLVATGASTPLVFTLRDDPSYLYLDDISVTSSAMPILQNSAPVNLPTNADFLVANTVTTGGPTDSNTVNSLTFTPGSELTILNHLFVTKGPVSLVPYSGINLNNGTLWTSLLQIVPGSFLRGNGGIEGSVSNSGLVSPGHSPGSISMTGNYDQSPVGILQIQIAGRKEGQFDVLNVGGKANLNGTLLIQQLDNFHLRRGDKFRFLNAGGGVFGEFSQVADDFASDTILNPKVIYHKGNVTLEVPTFESFARAQGFTPNQISVARGVDSLNYDRRASQLIDYLDSQNVRKLPRDFDKIAPEELTSVFTLGVSLAQVQSGNIQRRTADIRAGSGGFSAAGLAINGMTPSYSGDFGRRTGIAGPSGDDGKAVKETRELTPEEKRWGTFLSGTGEWVSVGNTDNARGYNLESGGFTLGVDYKVTSHLAVGLAAGYTGTTADLTDNGRVWVNGGKIGLYATFFQNEPVPATPTMSKDASKDAKEVQPPAALIAKGFYGDMAVFGGYNGYEFRRSALQGEARGDTDGGELNVLAGIGYDFKKGNFTFGPTASFNYTYLGTNTFTEHGSLAPLEIHGGKGESLRTAFGMKASYDWKLGGVLIKPELRAAWQHEYGDAAYALESSFANGAGDSFRVNGPQLGRDSVLLGAGFVIQINERCATYFYYDGELGRKDYQSTSVTGGVRLTF